jgi:pyridoxal phosphate enzyme (YggS family)
MIDEQEMSVADRLAAVNQRIAEALERAGRPHDAAGLIAVSKRHPASAIREAMAAGQKRFGENYLQEALEKISLLGHETIEWHFIGALQSNKSRAVAEHFDWVHTIDRIQIAERLSRQRPTDWPPLRVCIQVNVDGEASKSGVNIDQLLPLALRIAELPRLELRGLMSIPAPVADDTTQTTTLRRRPHALLARELQRLNQAGLQLDTLSMGMSDDLEEAIVEGATLVRVGTAIFGSRPSK